MVKKALPAPAGYVRNEFGCLLSEEYATVTMQKGSTALYRRAVRECASDASAQEVFSHFLMLYREQTGNESSLNRDDLN